MMRMGLLMFSCCISAAAQRQSCNGMDHHENKSVIRCVVSVAGLLLTFSAEAQPLNIQVLDAQYATLVSAAVRTNFPFSSDVETISRLSVSAEPANDELIVPGVPDLFGSGGRASARSSLFEVEGYTSAHYNVRAYAGATNQIWFSPMVDQDQSVDIEFSRGNLWQYTSGSVQLYDMTSDSEVWTYGWFSFGPDVGTIPWIDDYTAQLLLPTSFMASHQYELTMSTWMDAADDSEVALIRLTGLQVIPEPSTTLLLAAFGAVLLLPRRR